MIFYFESLLVYYDGLAIKRFSTAGVLKFAPKKSSDSTVTIWDRFVSLKPSHLIQLNFKLEFHFTTEWNNLTSDRDLSGF